MPNTKKQSPRLLPLTLLLCFAVQFLALTTSAVAGSLEEVIKASDKARADVKKAIANSDSGLLSSLFTADGAIITANGHTISGRMKIRMTAKIAMLTGESGALTNARGAISVIDDTGYETGSYSFAPDGSSSKRNQALSGHYTIIWRIEDKAWKIHRVIALK